MSEDQIKKVFDLCDTHHVGYVTAVQLMKLIHILSDRKYVLPLNACTAIIMYYTNTPFMTYDHFYVWWTQKDIYKFCTDPAKSRLIEIYNLVISNSNFSKYHELEYDDMKSIMMNHKIKISHKTFNNIDTDHNGKISFREFCNWLKWFSED